MKAALFAVGCMPLLGAAYPLQPSRLLTRYGEAGNSMLCMTVINHLPPSFVITKFNKPFLSGMS